MGYLLRGQENVSGKRPMPVADTNMSSTASTTAAAVVQLYYYDVGVRTIDAGQAAGVVVDGVFAHRNILNALGTTLGGKNDTSLAYTCDALLTELEISARPDILALWEALDDQSAYTRAVQIGALLKNGEFIVDYRRGMFIGKKATATATMTAVTYKYSVSMSVVVDSEFPAPAALADATANPTTTTTGANMFGFNGTTWDRIRTGVSTATSTLTGWLNALPVAIYRTVALSKIDGQVSVLESDSAGNLKGTQATRVAGEDLTKDVTKVEVRTNYTNISASALIATGAGTFSGFMVNSCAAGATVKFWAQTTAAVPVLLNTITYTLAATQGGAVVRLPEVEFTAGLYCTIAVAAADITVFWKQ